MERRRLAGIGIAVRFHHIKPKTPKKFSKKRKHLKARNLRSLFQKIFLKKRELGRVERKKNVI